jgi:hypothetical protein
MMHDLMRQAGLVLRQAGLLALLLVVGSAPLAGQTRPRLTEEAATGPAGRLSLEVGADVFRGEPNFLTGRERDRWDLPVLRLTHSPAEAVEVDLEWVGRVMARDDPDFGDVSDYGDVTLRAKVRFLEERRGRPALAARFGVTLPQTSFGNGLGPNTLRMSVQLLLTRSWGGLAVHANGGLAIHDEALRPHEQRDFLAYGLALVQDLGRLGVSLEAAGLAGDGMPGADARGELRAGLRLTTGRLACDAALRHGLTDADGGWGATAGVSWTLRAGR